MLANLVKADACDSLVLYLVDNESGETLPAFVLMSYVTRNTLPDSDASFSCNYNGEKKTWSLGDMPVVVLQFNRDEACSGRFPGNRRRRRVYSGIHQRHRVAGGEREGVRSASEPRTGRKTLRSATL